MEEKLVSKSSIKKTIFSQNHIVSTAEKKSSYGVEEEEAFNLAQARKFSEISKTVVCVQTIMYPVPISSVYS